VVEVERLLLHCSANHRCTVARRSICRSRLRALIYRESIYLIQRASIKHPYCSEPRHNQPYQPIPRYIAQYSPITPYIALKPPIIGDIPV